GDAWRAGESRRAWRPARGARSRTPGPPPLRRDRRPSAAIPGTSTGSGPSPGRDFQTCGPCPRPLPIFHRCNWRHFSYDPPDGFFDADAALAGGYQHAAAVQHFFDGNDAGLVDITLGEVL